MADDPVPPAENRSDQGNHPKTPLEPRDTHHPSPVSPKTQAIGERQAMMRLASAGFELASFSLILGGGGYAVDHWLGNVTPYFAIAGLLLGFSLGFYRLIILASKVN